MLVVPYEKLPIEETVKRNHLLSDIFGNLLEGYKDLTEEETIKELMLLYQKGIILEPLEIAMYLIDFDFLRFYKLMIVLTKNNKHNRQVFINSFGTLEDEKSVINKLLK